MSWICPKCSRKFHTERLYHSCDVVTMDDHLDKSQPEIKKLALSLIKKILTWKNVQVTPLKSMILITAGSNFMSIKPRKTHLEIEFILNEEKNEFPVFKTMSYGKKFVHYIKIDSKEDVNPQLMGWLKDAYQLAAKIRLTKNTKQNKS